MNNESEMREINLILANLKAELGEHALNGAVTDADGFVVKDSGEAWIEEADSGGKKQAKERAYSSMPWEALRALSKHYALGLEKYPNDEDTNQPNYRKGYPASLSFEAMIDHAIEWNIGNDIDPENGSHHILAVAWHALNLYLLSNTEWDDRWRDR